MGCYGCYIIGRYKQKKILHERDLLFDLPAMKKVKDLLRTSYHRMPDTLTHLQRACGVHTSKVLSSFGITGGPTLY